jgi:hypothetical protein
MDENVTSSAELESERCWEDLFARSRDMLLEMAAEAIREDEAGLTKPLNSESFRNEPDR